MMKKIVVYVRHAESEANVIIHKEKDKLKKLSDDQDELINSYIDPNITSLGEQQALYTAKYLIERIRLMNKTNITVWISPFRRTQETAKYFINLCIENNITYKVQIIPELQEYTTNKKPVSEILIDNGIVIHKSFSEFVSQVIIFNNILKNELRKQDQNTIHILFGHSLFFSVLMSYHIIHEQVFPKNISSLQLPNCSISCEALNETYNNSDNNESAWLTFVVGSISHLPNNIVTGNHIPFSHL